MFGCDAWAGGSGAGEKADGSVVRAVLGAWGWAGSLRLLSRHGLFRTTRHSRKSLGHVSYECGSFVVAVRGQFYPYRQLQNSQAPL